MQTSEPKLYDIFLETWAPPMISDPDDRQRFIDHLGTVISQAVLEDNAEIRAAGDRLTEVLDGVMPVVKRASELLGQGLTIIDSETTSERGRRWVTEVREELGQLGQIEDDFGDC